MSRTANIIIEPGLLKDGDTIRYTTQHGLQVKRRVERIIGYGEGEGGPYIEYYSERIQPANRPDFYTFHSATSLVSITHLNGRAVASQLRRQSSQKRVSSSSMGQPALTPSEGDSMAKTKTRKSLSEMSDSHRERIERWEPHLDNLGGVHVWHHVFRVPGRNVEGPCYVAVKRGDKDYIIADYDTVKKFKVTKSKILEDGFTTSGAVTEAFKKYRDKARKERDAARADKKSGSTKRTAAKKTVAKKAPAKASAKAPARKPGAKKPARTKKPARSKS